MLRLLMGILVGASLCLVVPAQNTRTVGVSGTSVAGTAFTMQIVGQTITRTYDFASLAVDYSPLAMAQLMIDRINTDFSANGNTGFQARNAQKADGRDRYDATFVIDSNAPINNILVGVYGMPNSSLPRAPGVGFNPNFTNFEANSPTPFTRATFNSPTASLRINGQDPDLDFNHRVEIVVDPNAGGISTVMSLQFSTGANPSAGLILLYGPFNHGVFSVPWGGTLDLGTPNAGLPPIDVTIVADGIFAANPPLNALFVTSNANPAVVAFPFPIPTSAPTLGFQGFQGLVTDPSNPPFFYRMTSAAQPVFDYGQEGVRTVGTDGFVPINLRGGGQFRHYGNVYTQLFASENGFITLLPPTLPGTVVDPQQFVTNGTPAIFVNWANWDLSIAGGIDVFEFGDELRVRWGRPGFPIRHFGQADAAMFECVMRLERGLVPSENAGSVIMDYRQLSGASPAQDDALVGVTAGMGLDPLPLSRDIGRPQVLNGPNRSIFAQFNRGANFASQLSVPIPAANPGSTTFLPQLYHNGSNLNGRWFGFFPAPASPSPSSATGPYSIPSRPNPNDAVGVYSATGSTPTISRTPGTGQPFIIIGSFRLAFGASAPTVVLNPFGPQPVTLQNVGIHYDGPSIVVIPQVQIPAGIGLRDFEGLAVVNTTTLPPAAYPIGSLVDVLVTFGAGTPGASFLLPGALQVVP